jgi:hypothetical protein
VKSQSGTAKGIKSSKEEVLSDRFEWPQITCVVIVCLALPLIAFQFIDSFRYWIANSLPWKNAFRQFIISHDATLLGVAMFLAGLFGARLGARAVPLLLFGILATLFIAHNFRGSTPWAGTFEAHSWTDMDPWQLKLLVGGVLGIATGLAINYRWGVTELLDTPLIALFLIVLLGCLGGLAYAEGQAWWDPKEWIFPPTRHQAVFGVTAFCTLLLITGEISRRQA